MEILIIGGIAAGASIASKAKRTNKDANVSIIEIEDYVSFGACGLPYYVGGQFDEASMMYARSPQAFEDQGINLYLGHKATHIDFDKKEVKITNLKTNEEFIKKYDRLAIATGAYPVSPIKDKTAENLLHLTKERDANKILEQLETAEEIIVIGGGFIGIETAEQIAHKGKKVKLIQRSDVLMGRVFDREFSEYILDALKENGVEVLLNTALQDYTIENDRITEVVTSEGSYEADLVIEALGFRPNTDFIDDERLLKLGNGAIIIDDMGQTSIEDVFAAGDCASVCHRQMEKAYIALATYANKMGRIVGNNIVSEKKDYDEFVGALGSSLIRIGEYGAGVTGLTEDAARDQEIDYVSHLTKTSNHSGYWPGQSRVYIKLVYNRENRQIIGGQVFGKYGAAERLQAITMAVYNKNTVDELGFIDFAYAPPFASVWEALNVAGNAAK